MKFLNSSLLIFGLFILGGAIFKTTAPTRCATILPDDSVFVLTGDARRIPFATRQIRKHPTATMYIIGAGASGGHKSDRVIIESDSKSTYQNALAIKRIADSHGLDRIVLVTTVDHFNRAKYLIRHEMPNTEIAACPAPLTGMPATKRLERWTTEYVKYIGTLVGIRENQ
ncbi:MAG: YdcF family protein [Rickettsiales bacterium]|jgi:uncharacterized SAM-binding protein YcdF (DUF218 family)|nr:YdcF family protein [Rickettsiales bacterium]